MIRILQWYITRELGKTFLLWAFGLTMVFTLCGGVLNMVRVEGAGALQMMRVVGFVIPVAMTLTFPVAALVSTALTYGRLSADNEINACRSSGINVHVLLIPAVVLSLLVAGFTFAFYNFVIPSFVHRLDVLLREDLHKIVMSQLRQHGSIKYGEYVMYADQVDAVAEEIGTSENPSDLELDEVRKILIRGGAFIELGGEEWLRFGTSKSALVRFDNTGENPTVTADLLETRGYDRLNNQQIVSTHDTLGPYPIPRAFEMDVKWLDLKNLIHLRNHPEETPSVQKFVGNLRAASVETLFYHYLIESLREPPHVYAFQTGRMKGEFSAETFQRDSKTQRPSFENVTVTLIGPNRKQRFLAENGSIRVQRVRPPEIPRVTINLTNNVRLYDSLNLNPAEPIKKQRDAIPPFDVDPAVLERAEAYSDADLLNKELSHLSTDLENSRVGIRKEIQKLILEMTGIIHARTAFSASVLVLVILGGALGIIFRGADYLTAFFVSFLPGLLIVVSIIMGRQLTENSNTTAIGIAVIWSSIAVMAAADGVVLTRFLRR